jgi:hypothetical protein
VADIVALVAHYIVFCIYRKYTTPHIYAIVIKINKKIYIDLFQELIISIALARLDLEYMPNIERKITCINSLIKINIFLFKTF